MMILWLKLVPVTLSRQLSSYSLDHVILYPPVCTHIGTLVLPVPSVPFSIVCPVPALLLLNQRQRATWGKGTRPKNQSSPSQSMPEVKKIKEDVKQKSSN